MAVVTPFFLPVYSSICEQHPDLYASYLKIVNDFNSGSVPDRVGFSCYHERGTGVVLPVVKPSEGATLRVDRVSFYDDAGPTLSIEACAGGTLGSGGGTRDCGVASRRQACDIGDGEVCLDEVSGLTLEGAESGGSAVDSGIDAVSVGGASFEHGGARVGGITRMDRASVGSNEEKLVGHSDSTHFPVSRGKNWERNQEWKRQKKEKKKQKKNKKENITKGSSGALESMDWNADRVVAAEARKVLNGLLKVNGLREERDSGRDKPGQMVARIINESDVEGELKESVKRKWIAKNKLQAIEAERRIAVLGANSVEDESRRYRTNVQAGIERNMVSIEKTHSILAATGNVPEVFHGSVETVLTSSGSISPDSSASQAEFRAVQKENLDLTQQVEKLRRALEKVGLSVDAADAVDKCTFTDNSVNQDILDQLYPGGFAYHDIEVDGKRKLRLGYGPPY